MTLFIYLWKVLAQMLKILRLKSPIKLTLLNCFRLVVSFYIVLLVSFYLATGQTLLFPLFNYGADPIQLNRKRTFRIFIFLPKNIFSHNFLEWQICLSYAEKFLFYQNYQNHRKVSLAVYSPIIFFSFCQKTNLHFYKRSRLP